ncbi:MAG: class I SAM-dependent methyltransferase [Verrucomicrobiota bacterium]|nr:class I SAM-dependent methyltransferase [Verrucomicrobiota bacterium]
MQKLVQRQCPVCKSSNYLPYLSKESLQLVKCLECGMTFSNPVAEEFITGSYYNDSSSYYLSEAKLAGDYSPVRFSRELAIFRRFSQRGRLLDVGCSTGAFLYQVGQRWPGDYEMLGTDVAGPALDFARAKGVNVTSAHLFDEECDWGKFDAITYWAVLEHLPDPSMFLKRSSELLKPNGHCFVLVPNFNALAVKLLGARYRYILPQHLNYFTRHTLRRLADEHFTILYEGNSHFNPAVIYQDWKRSGRTASDQERAALLAKTTLLKNNRWLLPLREGYKVAERVLALLNLADNLVLVLRKR